jgi:hypothetical protein
MSILELAKSIDKPALLSVEGLSVPVTIRNVRQAYGRTDYQVTPAGGTGVKWVDASRVKVKGGQA